MVLISYLFALLLSVDALLAEESNPIQDAGNVIYLTVGGRQELPLASSSTVRVKGPKVAQIDNLGSRLRLTGLQVGSLKLTLGSRAFQVYVVAKNQISFFKALQNQLKIYLGLEAVLEGGQVEVRGHLYRLSDWQEIHELAKEFNSSFQMAAQLDPDVVAPAQAWLRELVTAKGLALPGFEFDNLARAYISDEQKKWSEHWDNLLGPAGVKRIYEKAQVTIEPLVRVHIVVAEVNKKLQSQLGVEWPEMISATLSPKLTTPNGIEVFLKAMEQNGLGQILASPNLLARSGAEAEFLAGGEFAIKIITSRSREVVWKKHGILLKIKPTADRLGHLSVALTTEVSLVDQAQAVEGVPALKTNRMSTHFDLTEARTIVLSGLIRRDWGESQNGLMGLSKIPVLGSLFGSKNFHDNKTELVIFVTPEIVRPTVEPSPDTKQLMPKTWVTHAN